MVLRVTPSDTIASLTRAISYDRPQPYQLTDQMLTRQPATSHPCQAIVARLVEPPFIHLADTFDGTFLDLGDWLQASMEASEAHLFLQTCHASGLSDLLWSLGWNLFQIQEPHPSRRACKITIMPSKLPAFR